MVIALVDGHHKYKSAEDPIINVRERGGREREGGRERVWEERERERGKE
jgi:hypothetical protein